MALPQPRPGVMSIPLYEAGKSSIKGTARVIKLSSNEAALGASPHAMAAYGPLAETLYRYPLGDSHELRTAIAEVHGLDVARIICGCGSDEMFALLCRAYAGPGDEVIHTEHAFAIFAIYARSVGAIPVAVKEKNLTADVDTILAAVTPNTKLVFLANPNNPTGTCVPAADIVRLRDGLREDIVLVLDGAYAEFVEAPDYDGGFMLARTTPNTVATRTFSKIYGLAALRLGWAYGPAAIIGAMERLRAPFNVTKAAQAAGVAAVRDQAHIAKAKAHNIKWKQIALQRLRGLGLQVADSAGNFILPEFPTTKGRTAAEADAFLQTKGLIVRRVDGYGLPNHLRITIGNEEEMTAVLDALAAFMESRHG
ncbi:MAG: histidinol-phosphate transaminase [Rhodospirillaceae bacterium]|nr:histidinol-phosphate transaminase [Rhodospirillaceae bacterium]